MHVVTVVSLPYTRSVVAMYMIQQDNNDHASKEQLQCEIILTLFAVMLICCAGVWIYHSGLKASGSWAVFSLSSLKMIRHSKQLCMMNRYQ